MLWIICVLVILHAYDGHLTPEDGWSRTLHRVPRNYASQSQNDKSVTTEDTMKPHGLNLPVFGTRIKPRIINYYDYRKEVNKIHNTNTYAQLNKHESQKSENDSSRENNSTEQNIEQNIQSKLNLTETKNKHLKTDDRVMSVVDASNRQQSQNLLDIESKNSLEIYDLQRSESGSFGKRVSRDYFENKYNQSPQIGTRPNGKPKSLISFRSSNKYNGQYVGYGWKQNKSPLKTSLRQILYPQNLASQNVFESNCNATSNTLFIRKPGSNSVNVNGQIPFKARGYLPPVDKTTSNKTKENLPPNNSKTPCCNGKPPITTFTTTKRPFNATAGRPYYTIGTITKRPLPTNTSSTTTITATTKKPYYIPFDNQRPTAKAPFCHACSSTSGPFYIPVTKPSTTIPDTGQPGDTKGATTSKPTTTSRTVERGDVPDEEDITTATPGAVAPAMAMPVPPEPDEPIATTTMSPVTTMSIPPNMKETTTRRKGGVAPAMAMPVPPEPDEPVPMTAMSPVTTMSIPPTMKETTTRRKGGVAPAMAMPVPPEPDEPIPTTAMSPRITTFSPPSATATRTTLTNTTPIISPKSTTILTTETPEYNRHQVEAESLPTLSMGTDKTTPTTFKGDEYLPPDGPPTKMPVIDTNKPGPASAMPVPPEPEEVPSVIPPSTTKMPPSTVSVSTSMTSKKTLQTTTDYINRHLLEDSGSATTMIAELMTTTTPFKAPDYLPPKNFTTKKSGGDFTGIPESLKPDIPLSKTTATTVMIASSNTTMIPDTNPFKAPEYLPPREASTFPKSATAMPVTSEPECSLDSNDTPDIDQRSFVKNSCSPTNPSTSHK